jgi:hypothetical protein
MPGGKLAEPRGSINEQVGTLLGDLEALQGIARRKLLDGESTAECRARKAEIERQIERLRAAGAAAGSESERARVGQIAKMADMLVQQAVRVIEDLLLELQPPQHPGEPK